MLIDVHTHLWETCVEESKQGILSMCETFGIDKVYVSGLHTYCPDEAEVTRLNDYVVSFMREHPGLVEGYCYLNPRNANSLSELRRRIPHRGKSRLQEIEGFLKQQGISSWVVK